MNKLILVALVAASLSACSTRPRMNYEDLNTFKIDCANKDAQLRFLQSQISSKDERIVAAFGISAVTRFFSETEARQYDTNKHISNRSTDAIVRSLIWDIRTYCP